MAALDCPKKGGVVCLVLPRVGEGEPPHRFVERETLPEVSGDDGWLRCLRVRPCKYGPAEPCIFDETGSVELFNVHRSLHVPELPHVVVSVSHGGPPEKRIGCSLHDLLSCHNAAALVV